MTTRNHRNAYMRFNPDSAHNKTQSKFIAKLAVYWLYTIRAQILRICFAIRIINAMHFVRRTFRFTLFIDWIINYANMCICSDMCLLCTSIAHILTAIYSAVWMSAIYIYMRGAVCVFYELNTNALTKSQCFWRTTIVLCSLPKSETQLSRSELSECVTRSHIVNDSERNYYMLENCAFQIYFIVFSRFRLVGLWLLDFYNLSWFTLKAGILASAFGSRLYKLGKLTENTISWWMCECVCLYKSEEVGMKSFPFEN